MRTERELICHLTEALIRTFNIEGSATMAEREYYASHTLDVPAVAASTRAAIYAARKYTGLDLHEIECETGIPEIGETRCELAHYLEIRRDKIPEEALRECYAAVLDGFSVRWDCVQNALNAHNVEAIFEAMDCADERVKS